MEKTQGVLLLVLLLCVVSSTCWGQQGNPVIMITISSLSYELSVNVNLVSLNSVPDSGIWS